jgi:UDP-N-acetylglucosamine 1-carboxyvinyltransferase
MSKIQGYNFTTKAIVAALLANGKTTLTNVPNIGDVDITRRMCLTTGARIDWIGLSEIEIDSSGTSVFQVPEPDSGTNRISRYWVLWRIAM